MWKSFCSAAAVWTGVTSLVGLVSRGAGATPVSATAAGVVRRREALRTSALATWPCDAEDASAGATRQPGRTRRASAAQRQCARGRIEYEIDVILRGSGLRVAVRAREQVLGPPLYIDTVSAGDSLSYGGPQEAAEGPAETGGFL